MSEGKVIILQGSDIKKLQQELACVIRESIKPPCSITQSQSAIPVIGSRQGWENVITITVVYSSE